MSQAQNRQSQKRYKKPLAPPRPQPNGRKLQRNSISANLRRQQPLIFWGGVWAIVFLVSITALANLLNPASSKDPQLAQTQMQFPITTTVAQPTTGQSQSPIWLFGAIVLSCSATSFLLARQLMPTSAHASRQRSKRKVAHQRSQASIQRPVSQPINRPTSDPVPTFRPSKEMRRQPAQPQAASLSQPIPTVSAVIVSSEQSHPLDWGEGNLAELLDLRKQSPHLWGYRRQRG